MSLVNIAKQYAADEWASQNFAEVANVLASTTVDIQNTEGITMGIIGERLGFAVQVLVSDTLRKILDGQIQIPVEYAVYKGVILDARDRLLADTGMTLYSQDRQQLLGIVAQIAGWPNEVLTAIQGLGITKREVWKYHGLPSVPTESDVQSAYLKDQLSKVWSGKQDMINAAGSITEMIITLREIADSLENN